ncbi:hypothetical protein LX32DRAFT_293262 [Colletotrichum zoysiae]|uniref:Uncharacterized protein n=1 Tax=Colletotrichum zoysiae TaxID=1216348 RepID=A0AAD9M1X7_9PEZI|nr:hypothetical protein LX32DRAFT_293262 [Colletotrichum zoysiae]
MESFCPLEEDAFPLFPSDPGDRSDFQFPHLVITSPFLPNAAINTNTAAHPIPATRLSTVITVALLRSSPIPGRPVVDIGYSGPLCPLLSFVGHACTDEQGGPLGVMTTVPGVLHTRW